MTEGIANLEAVIARLEQATADAREATAETHSAIKALRSLMREAEHAQHEFESMMDKAAKYAVDEHMKEAIDRGLEEFREAYTKAMDRQVAHVTQIFERRSNLVMYGNEQGKGVNIFDAMGEYLAQFKERMEIDPRMPSLYGQPRRVDPPNSRRERRR